MTRDRFRSIGALIGLTLGILLMRAFQQAGVLPGALFGAGGALVGGVLGEQLHALFHRES